MLNMSFNPDFGQVEADPSVLNLSAFETRLSEKRPFFVQGANFFKSRFNLFNSRRIGRAPGFYAPESGSIVDKPEATTILGSAKLMGKSASGLRYGIINAVTNEEYGLLEYFMRNQEKVLTRTMIAEHVWDYNFDTFTNVIDVYINHLRNKIDKGRQVKLLHTLRGVGYIMKK
mgnify:CR=1 FL=1